MRIYAKSMMPPAITRNRYINNFFAMLLVISGFQLLAISTSPVASALTWTDVTNSSGWHTQDWVKIRTNNDGSVIAGVTAGASQSSVGDLHLSRDFGSSWIYTATSAGVLALAVSNDGNKVIAARDSIIYRASYTGSAWSYPAYRTWSSPSGSGINQRCAGYGPNFNSLAASSDGTKWVAGVRDESCVYTSTDSGENWSNTNIGGTNWGSAISSDGTIKMTSNSNGKVYRNSGSGWSQVTGTGLPGTGLSGMACDATCSKMSAYLWDGKIYTSSDSGSNWSAFNSSRQNWVDMAMSSDGSIIAAVTSSDVYVSTDSGQNWTGQGLSGGGWVSVTISGDGKKIYAASSTGVIKKSAFLTSQSITFTNPSDMTYGDADQSLTYSASSGLSVTIASNTTSICTIVTNKIHIVSPGTCTVTANQNGDSTYAAATQVSKSITVSKAPSTISVIGSTSLTYNGAPQGPMSVTKSGSTGSVTYSYSARSPTVYAASSTAPTNVGTYSVTATLAADNNFLAATSSSYNFDITKASQSPTLTISSTSGTFGANLSLSTAGGTGSGAVSFVVDSGPCSVSGSTLTPSGAGTCMVTATKAASLNYLSASSASTAIAIAKRNPDFTWSGLSKVYGESFTLTAPDPSTAGTFTYSSASPSVVALNGDTATVVGIGSSIITATFTPNDTLNYASGDTVTATITTSRAPITVTPTAGQSKVYGSNDPTLSYTITSGSLIGSDTLSGALTYSGSNVGSYTFTIGTLTNSKYTITLDAETFAITKATQNVLSLSSLSAAYDPSNKTVSLTGTGASGSGSYSYQLHGSNTTPGCTVTGSSLTYTTAGTCVIAVTHSGDTNHLARTDAVSFTIGLASQTITFGSLSAKSYSSETFTVSATSSASLTVVFTSGSTSVCTTSGTNGSTVTLLGVGTCVINANQAGDANTGAASQVSQNFTVNPRAITVTADAKSKVFGASDPTFTYSITTGSLLLGDALTGALTRAAGTDVGTYQIQQGTLTTSNNPKYAITYASADLSITRGTPTLVLSYPNSNVAILRPGATDTPTVTTTSSAGSLTYATSAASSICTVNSTSGVISLFGAGSCPIAMTTAQTANYLQHTETTTVTVALLSTSLTGLNQSNLLSMGQPFYAHASIDQSYSFSSGSNGASVSIPAGALDASVPISIHLLADSTDQRALITSDGTSVLSVVVSWVASDGSVPSTNTGKAISVTLTNPAIKNGAKVYSIIGNQSQLLGTATADGSITTLITEDPVLLVINPVVTAPAPSPTSSGGGGGGGYVMAVVVDNSAAIEAANLKLAADKAAAELKAAQEKAAAAEAEAAAIKAARDLADAQAQAAAELKASQEKAAEELRIAEELRLAQLKAEADLKLAAEKKALSDFATAARNAKAAVTLYSVSPSLKLNSYDSAYLAKYVKSLKNSASVTCIGYTYGKSPASKASQALAKRQATADCAQMKKTNKTLKTSIVIYPATKAPKAAVGAKWVGVSYRIDGLKSK